MSETIKTLTNKQTAPQFSACLLSFLHLSLSLTESVFAAQPSPFTTLFLLCLCWLKPGFVHSALCSPLPSWWMHMFYVFVSMLCGFVHMPSLPTLPLSTVYPPCVSSLSSYHLLTCDVHFSNPLLSCTFFRVMNKCTISIVPCTTKAWFWQFYKFICNLNPQFAMAILKALKFFLVDTNSPDVTIFLIQT